MPYFLIVYHGKVCIVIHTFTIYLYTYLTSCKEPEKRTWNYHMSVFFICQSLYTLYYCKNALRKKHSDINWDSWIPGHKILRR